MDIGKRLRKLRLKQKLTLEHIAKEIGFTKSFLSQVELNRTSPSIASLLKILNVLNISMDDFFKNERRKKGIVLRKKDRKSVFIEQSKVKIEMLSTGFHNPKIEPLYAELDRGSDTDFVFTEGEMFGIILQGSVELSFGKEIYILQQGDSVYLDCTVPHRWRNVGKQKASGIWVSTHAAFYDF